jgi:hypothetical protein
MKNKIIILILFFLIPVLLSSQNKIDIVTEIESGTYVQDDLVTVEKLRLLPVPKSKNNYAFFQSIDNKSNIIIGNFNANESMILLIQDSNADGKVDIVASWYPGTKKQVIESDPGEFCTIDKFKILKEVIFNGKTEKIILGRKDLIIKPNPQGISRYEQIINGESNIVKYKQGLRVTLIDPDDRTKEMEVYSYSQNDSDKSADVTFKIIYSYKGNNRVNPIINFSIYCSKSHDPFVIETVKQLREISKKYYNK